MFKPTEAPSGTLRRWTLLTIISAPLWAGCDDGGGNDTGNGGADMGGVTADGGVMPDADPLIREDMGVERCEFDEACGPDLICDREVGECVDPECTEAGLQGECDDGQLCLGGRCVDPSPTYSGAFCVSCGLTSSAGFTLIGGVEPGAVGTLESESFRLEAGAIRAFAGEDEQQ